MIGVFPGGADMGPNAMLSKSVCVIEMAAPIRAIAQRPNRPTTLNAGGFARIMPLNIIATGIILQG